MPTIADVIARLDLLIAGWDRSGDYRAVFARSYRIITRRMAKAIAGGFFEDNAWMAALDVRFAQEYFDAVDDYDAGKDDVPRCWRLAFRLARLRQTTVLQDLLVGIDAHVLHDLAVALNGMGLPPAERALRRRDHDRVNDVLAGLINEVQSDLEQRYSWTLGLLDRLLGSGDEALTDEGLRTSRATAWVSAVALADAPNDATRRTLREGIDLSASAVAELVAAPSSLLSGVIRPLGRWERTLHGLIG